MSAEVLGEARKWVRHRLGSDFESKASDALVMKLYGGAVGAVAETVAAPEPAVIEFEPGQDLGARLDEMAEGIARLPAFRAASERVRGPASRAAAAPRRMARRIVRHAAVEEARQSFTQRCRAVRETLEKAARAAGAGEAAGPGSADKLVEICWLNQTLRTASATLGLAEVAAGREIRRLDVPRLIRAEVHQTAAVVGAVAFRKQHSVTGEGVIIAVIDSEADAAHPAFAGRVTLKGNFTKEGTGVPDRHGTAVAGIAASSAAKHLGIAPGATIFNYKVLATSPWLSADDFGGALAIQQALEDGAHVANCSWGVGPAGDGSSREARACNAAWALGLTLVKSAGNRGPGKNTLTTPADADGIIVVGATSRTGKRVEGYSSRGTTGDGRERPHLVAPGGNQKSPGITSALPGGGFGDAGAGTSYAAPHVAGLVALLLDQDPELTPDQVRDALIARAKPFGRKPDRNVQGAGLVVL